MALDGGKGHCSRPGRFTPCKRARVLHKVEDWAFWREEILHSLPQFVGRPAHDM